MVDLKKLVTPSHKYEISTKDLPLSCPLPDMPLWQLHPRVFIAIEKIGKADCPYCGTQYVLKDFIQHSTDD